MWRPTARAADRLIRLSTSNTDHFTTRWQPAATLDEGLERAASEFRIQPEYIDNWGKTRTAKPAVRAAVLRSLGVPVDSLAALNAYLEARLRARWTRLLPVTLVTGPVPEPGQVAIHVPAGTPEDARLRLWIRLEDGKVESGDWRLGDLAVVAEAWLGAEHFVRRALQFQPPVPLGYHELRASVDGDAEAGAPTRWIVGPDQTWQSPEAPERMAGLAVSVYGLRSDRNWGVGDFTDLTALSEWGAAELGIQLVGLNPLHAIHNRQPFNTSPYLPVSAHFRNPLYLDIDAVPEMAASERAQSWRRRAGITAEIAALRQSEFVEYERAWRLKRLFLRVLFRQMEREVAAGSARGNAFELYLAREADGPLREFAIYCALDPEMHRRDQHAWSWPQWPAEFQSPASQAVSRYAAAHPREIRFHCYLQFLIAEQLGEAQRRAQAAGMAIGLYQDLALATDRGGCDTWMMPELFVRGCRVGSPPDGFSPEGQDWSFPPPAPEAVQHEGYRAFRDLIQRNARDGGALRFDHVMRFFRLFWIPDGFPAKDGVYVYSPAEELLRVLALESQRGRFLVIGEDLGTVTGEIRELLDRFGVLGYRLLYFERQGEGFVDPASYPRQAVASITTHDLPTFAGFWLNADIEARRAANLLPDEKSYRDQRQSRMADQEALASFLEPYGFSPVEEARTLAALRCLAATPSRILMVNQEELTGDAGQANLPGSTAEHPNWRRKMRRKIEEFRTNLAFVERIRRIRTILVQREEPRP